MAIAAERDGRAQVIRPISVVEGVYDSIYHRLMSLEIAPGAEFDDFAHRFSVTIVAALDDAQLACARRLVEMHKPAHTGFTLCTACAGIRAGVGDHVGLSTVVGKSAGFEVAIVGDSALDQGYLLGRPPIQEGA